jgi:hypothetical protein
MSIANCACPASREQAWEIRVGQAALVTSGCGTDRATDTQTHIPALRGLATVIFVGAALVVPSERIGASVAAEQSDRKLEAGYEQQPVSVGTPICSSPTSCVVPFSLFGVGTGDVAGTIVQAGAGSRRACEPATRALHEADSALPLEPTSPRGAG